jgi:uncharacterized protein (DUF1015 family)
VTRTDDRQEPAGLALTPVDLHLVDQEVAERVIPPPADALDEEQRAALLAEEPLSLLHVLGPEGEGGADAGQLAGARLRELIDAGRYRSCGPIFALHELSTPQHRQVGLVAGIPMADVQDGRVRPHEATRADRERELADFLDAAGMDVSPVVLTHELVPALEEVIAEVVERPADLDFLGWHQVHHRVWIVRDPAEQGRIRDAAARIESLTIVDGHHRVAAARASVDRGSPGAPATLLAELISEPELRMIGYDRRVRVDDPGQVGTVLAKLAEVAVVEPLPPGLPDRPTGETHLLVGSHQGWVRASFRDPPGEVPDRLPAAMLQDLVLAPYLGIEDPRSDPRLEFVAGLDDLAILDRCLADERILAFVPRPVASDELLEVARVGRTLPPKSTYVDPKPGPGVLVRVRREARGSPSSDP